MAMTTPMSTNSQSTTTPPQPSSTPSTDTSTTACQSNLTGELTTITTDGIVPATLAPTPMVNPPPVSQRRGPNYALIGTGIVAGLILLISVVALIWFLRCVYVTRSWTKSHIYILSRKNYRKSYALVDERDVVFPYPQSRQLDLTNESSPYESGLLGRSMRRTGSWRSVESHDGGLDSPPTALLTPAMSASGSLGTMHGAPTRVGEVGREASPFADPLSSDPASPDSYYSPSDSLSSGSVYSSNSTIISFQQRQLQAIDSLLTPKPR